MAGRVIFVGNLPLDIKTRELEDMFRKCGRITDIDLKLPPRPPGFGFVEFETGRDADNAVKLRDGYDFAGNRLRVEIAHGGIRRGPRGGGEGRREGRGSDNRGYGGGMGGGISRRSEFRVIITGLPKSASWQDLKDHMRKAGEVTYAQVFSEREGTIGLVDFSSKDDMKYAIRKLDDTEFKNPFEKSYIRIKEDSGGRDRKRSRTPMRSPSRSRSRSRSRDSRSRSRSKTPATPRKSKSKSKSASRSPLESQSPGDSAHQNGVTNGKATNGKATNGKTNGKKSASGSPARSDVD